MPVLRSNGNPSIITVADEFALRAPFSSFSEVSALTVQMKKALGEGPLVRKGSSISFYLPLLFLFEAFRGLSFLASPVPLFLLT
jgi:hypothetical protein